MNVYCIPVEIVYTGGRLAFGTFLAECVKNNFVDMDYATSDIDVKFRFFEDNDCYSILVLNEKVARSHFSLNHANNNFTVSVNRNTNADFIGELNMLIIKKSNLKGVYLHNEGSMTLGVFDQKLRQGYFNAIRAKHKTKKRDEKITITRLVDNSSIVDKLKKYKFIDEINVTFTTLTAKKHYISGAYKNHTKSVQIKMNTSGLDIGKKTDRDDLVNYIDGVLKGNAKSISVKGRNNVASAGEVIGLVDKANSVGVFDYDQFSNNINGMTVSSFLSNTVYLDSKNIVISHNLLK
ncbi:MULTISPECIES: hypothetical protein [Enterobacter cloacae complex]|uniref:hypothetical protein n=1 Tax=Enterobacter cloacae complex TaxID=354276 RepID=UPI0010116553|nr:MULTISPECIES: hypothetical protein [Enterobacter cloacae complex]MBG0579334.1 hypothetical protein [Enterobacter kobei]MCK7383368.1 hypothetical protein [Enterobacter cloacae]RYA41460.1 hypothetical protein DD603_13125 [Enterobacter cloacae complex sp. 2DZ2F2B]RYA45742.1 hypothetical protein DD605_06445 [Enterobacter cloacae complex sp. 3DZ3S2B]